MSEPTRHPRVTGAGKVRAFALLNPATHIAERPLMALVDVIACAFEHEADGGRYGTRLAPEAIVNPHAAVARAALTEGTKLLPRTHRPQGSTRHRGDRPARD